MKAKHTIAVRRREIYRVPRPGKPAAYIQIVSVRRGPQPKVLYRRVTKSGKPRRETALHWLQFVDGAWRLPATWAAVR